MKRLMLFLILIFGMISIHGQKIKPLTKSHCYFDQLIKDSPEIRDRMSDFDEGILNYQNIQSNRSVQNSQQITVPVVVYVIHPAGQAIGTGANISDAQVISQIEALNNYLSSYEIGFCLATLKGNSPIPTASGAVQNTPGIIHQASNTLTNHNALTDQENLVNSTATNTLGYYSGQKYLRIWVVSSINGLGSNIAGYSMFPNSSTIFDGIVMRYDTFGNNTNCTNCYNLVSNYDKGKTLVHEFGHYMGLYHTFESGCNVSNISCSEQGDRVCDTPAAAYPNYTCTSGTNSCTQDAEEDDITNYMDYGNDACVDHFTQGQKNRMENSFILNRSELISTSNLIYTGVCGYEDLVSADFDFDNFSPCVDSVIQFTAFMQNANSYLWDFGDGTTSSLANPSHGFNTPSLISPYNISLTVNGNNSSSTKTRTIFVTECDPIQSVDGNWYLGSANMLNFNTGVPVTTTMPVTNITSEAAAVQNDVFGNLIFYTNGVDIWDNVHNLVNPSNELLGNTSSLKGVAITPNPSNNDQYYIFTKAASNENHLNGFRYSIVNFDGTDISLSNVINQPISVSGFNLGNDGALISNESIGVSQNCNGFWIITTAFKNNQEYLVVFNLDANGLTKSDEFLIGSISNNNIYNLVTSIEVSPNGNFISFTRFYNSSNSIYLFSFDKFNGTVNSSVGDLSSISTAYDSQFSPDSNIIYFYSSTQLYSYNIETNTVLFLASIDGNNNGGIQLGPDNKIYLSVSNTNRLAAINTPNALSYSNEVISSNFTQFAGPLLTTNAVKAVPNIIDAKMNTSFDNTISSYPQSCFEYDFLPNICGNNFEWDFGDPNSGNNSSTLVNPTHVFSSPGTYTVSVTADNNQTISKEIIIELPTVSIIGDTSVCLPDNSTIYSTSLQPGETAEWSVTGGIIDGLNNDSFVTVLWDALPGTVELEITNSLGCTYTLIQNVDDFGGNDCYCSCIDNVSFTLSQVQGLTYSFYGSSNNNCSTGVLLYWFDYGDGGFGGYSSQHTYATGGTYNVTVEARLLGQYDQILCKSVLYQEEVLVVSRDSKTIENKFFKVYPNPTSKNINIRFDTSHEGLTTIKFKNVYGVLLTEQSFNAKKGLNNLKYELPKLINSGLFYAEISFLDEVREIKTIIVK